VTELEDAMATVIRQVQLSSGRSWLPDPTPEHRFHPTRKWRFDFCWPTLMIALEAEGGTWTGGAHTRGKHFESDCEKYNAAQVLGWQVYRFTTGMIHDGRLFNTLEQLFAPF
jgi:hypothetical protein